MATEAMPPAGAIETADPSAPQTVQGATETADPAASQTVQDATELAVLTEKVRQLETVAPDNVRQRDLEHFATKADLHAAVAKLVPFDADLHKSMVQQTWMIVGAIFLTGTLMVAALKLIPPV